MTRQIQFNVYGLCLLMITALFSSVVAQDNNVKIIESDKVEGALELVIGEKNEVIPLESLHKGMISSEVEIRQPLGSIWNQIPWPNPEINFFPASNGTPAGDLNGDGKQNVIISATVADERDDDISSVTGKTLIFLSDLAADEPDFIIYDFLIPVGDINGNGKANLWSQENGLIYEHDGTDFTTFSADLLTETSPAWTNIMADLNGDDADDAVRVLNPNILEVRFGGTDLNMLETVQYELNSLLTENEIEFIGSFNYKNHFEYDGTTWLMLRGLISNTSPEGGRYLLLVTINGEKDIEFQQFFKYSEFHFGNTGNFYPVTVSGETSPWLIFSHPFENDDRYIPAEDAEHQTYVFKPSDEEGKMFQENRIPLYHFMTNRLGDLTGNGNTELVVQDENGILFIGTIDAENDAILLGDRINYFADEGNLVYNIVTNNFYGDLTGDGNDNYSFRLNTTDIGGVPSSGALLIAGDENGISQTPIVLDATDYQRRIADNVFSLGDVTGNGFEDFVIYYTIGNAPNELVFHQGGSDWATPYQTWVLPNADYFVQDVIGGNFMSAERRDIALMISYRNEPGDTFLNSEIWVNEGGATISEEPSWILEAETFFPGFDEIVYNNFFSTMENVGDVNGSGFDDFIIGVTASGKPQMIPAGLFFGGTQLSNSGPDVSFEFDGYTSGWGIGMTLKGLGDISGNGIDDFAIGNNDEAQLQDAQKYGVNAGGRIHIFYGNEDGIFDSPDLTLQADTLDLLAGNSHWIFGFNEIAIGDFNNNGSSQIAAKGFRHHVGNETNNGVPGIHIFDPTVESSQPEFRVPLYSDLHASNVMDLENEFIGFMGRMQMAGVSGEAGDGLLAIGSSGFTNAVVYRGDGEGGLEPHTVYMAPNQRLTMGTPGNFINRQYRTPLADYTGDGKMNFITVQRGDGNFRDTPVYMYEIEETAVSNEPVTSLPSDYSLKQNYPNPFNPSTIISYQLPVANDVRLDVFDMLGRRVATLVNSRMDAGTHEVQFDAANLASGVYMYRLQAGSFTQTKRLTLIK